MVIISAPRAGLGVAACPHALVYGESERPFPGVGIQCWLLACEQGSHSLFVEPPVPERSVEAAPTSTVNWRQAEVWRRRNTIARKDGVGKLKKCICSSSETSVEAIAESYERSAV